MVDFQSHRGASIGHISPEAMEGGPIAAVHEGDIISINIPEGYWMSKSVTRNVQSRMSRWNTPSLR